MSSFKIVKLIRYLLYLLAITPLIVTPMTIFPFNFGRGLAIQFLIEIIFGLYLILAISDKNYRPKNNPVLIAFSGFVLVMFVSSVLGIDFLKSFWSSEERFTGWFYILHIYLLFIVLCGFFKNKKEWRNFLFWNICVALATFVTAISSLFGFKFWGVDLGKRISGTLGNPLFFASYLILNLIASLYLFFDKNGWMRIFGGFSSAAIIVGIILAQSRGAFLALAAGLCAAVFFFVIFGNKKYRIAGVSAIILIVLSLSALFIFRNSGFVKGNSLLGRFSNISLSAGTAQTRFINWQIALKGIAERPILGWGMEGFYAVFNKYYDPVLLRSSYYETWSDKPHNKVLETAVDGGAIGLVFYLAIFGSAIFILNKRRKEGALSPAVSSVFIGGFAAYFVQNLFVFDTPVSYLLFIILLAAIVSLPYGEREDKKMSLPLSLLALIFVLFAIGLNAIPFFASVRLRQTTLLYEVGKKNDMQGYKKAMSIFNPYKSEWRTDLAKSVVQEIKTGANLYSEEETLFALEELKKNTIEHPNDAYQYMLLGIFYSELMPGDDKYKTLAKQEFDKALELSPNRQHIYFALGRHNILLDDIKTAEDMYQKAIQLEPAAAISYWEAGRNFLIIDPESMSGKEQMITAVEMGYLPDNDRDFIYIFKNAYEYFYENKKYSVLVNLLARMVPMEPKNVELRAQYATALYLAGEKTSAIKEINKIISMDAGYKEEGEAFIRMINEEK